MNKKVIVFGLLSILIMESSCSSHHYVVGEISRTRILVDKTYDAKPDEKAAEFIKPYEHTVDSVMKPVVGKLAKSISGSRPESELSNLLSDILVWAAKDYGEKPVMGVYNMGGIRASMSAGDVTYGDVLEVAPFENKICFLTLSGDKLLQLFREMASVGGEGVSHGVELVITKDRKLESARLNGKEIDPKADYRIVTINYLAEGNDRMEAFKTKTDYVSPQAKENDTRYIISDYFEQMMKKGLTIDPVVEGRIKVK